MIDTELIRKNPDAVRANLQRRHKPELLELLDSVIEMDTKWRKAQGELDSLRAERNRLTEQVKKDKDPKIIKQAREVSEHVKALEDEVTFLKPKLDYELMKIPCMLDESVPDGKNAEDNVTIRTWGEAEVPAFELKPHADLTEALELADFEKAADVAGRGFNYLLGDMALLDRALQQFGIEFMVKKGFTLVQPPFLMRRRALEGVTDFEAFRDVLYKIENEDLHLIATSEFPLVAKHTNEILDEERLPILLAGISPCFRKEIGAHGVDTRGLYRMHQFNKVEQVVICKPSDSWKWFEKMQKISEEILQKLEIPYRVVNICTGDIGTKQAKQYDIEAWFPRQKKYGEVTSCSNCIDYQARRLNIKYGKRGGDKEYVHTLNNTGIATSRMMVAILENFQQKDGAVKIPTVLQKYMMRKKELMSLKK